MSLADKKFRVHLAYFSDNCISLAMSVLYSVVRKTCIRFHLFFFIRGKEFLLYILYLNAFGKSKGE